MSGARIAPATDPPAAAGIAAAHTAVPPCRTGASLAGPGSATGRPSAIGGPPSRQFLRRGVLAGLAASIAAGFDRAEPAPALDQRNRSDAPARITIDSKPIESFRPGASDQRRFGMMEFIGGLELTSSHPDFGGLSALRVAADGEHFVSLSDRGHWLTGRIAYDRGRPAGIGDAVMAPMLGPDGRTLVSRGWYDTESLAEQDGMFYVGIERVNRIVRFDFAKFGVMARAETVATPPGVAKLPSNKGLEALAFAPAASRLAGALIAFSERGLDTAGNLKAFIIGGATPGEFSVKRRDEFDISDCAVLPPRDLLLLERRFTWFTGVAMRVRRLAIEDIAPHALVDGPSLLFADMNYQIDNMEGISVHGRADGGTILTMVSDDNFSLLQRTILLQFRLIDD